MPRADRWFQAAASPRQPSDTPGTGKGKGKGKKGMAKKSRAGANKNSEPERKRRLERPEEGYWDETGVWVEPAGAERIDSDESVEAASLVTGTGPEAPTPTSVATRNLPTTPSPITHVKEEEDERAFSHKLSPRSLAVFGEVPMREPLFLPATPQHSDSVDGGEDEDDGWKGRRLASPFQEGDEDEEGDDRGRSNYYTPRSGHRSQARQPSNAGRRSPPPPTTRTILGELAIPSPDSSPPQQVPRRRNQTYSSRVPRTYGHGQGVNQQPQLSQTLYNSHHLHSRAPSPSQPTQRSSQHSQAEPIWSRVPYREEEDDDDHQTPEPEGRPRLPRLSIVTTQPEDDDRDYLSDIEVGSYGDSNNMGSDRNEEMEDEEARAHRDRSRRRQNAWGEWCDDREATPDSGHGRHMFATDSLESRNNYSDEEPAYHNINRHAFSYNNVPRNTTHPGRSRRHLVARRYYPNPLEAILEDDEPHRLKFTQTRHDFLPTRDAKNHQKIKTEKKQTARRRLKRLDLLARKGKLPYPKPIARITIEELRERYRFNTAKPFPISTQLIRAGHAATRDARRPTAVNRRGHADTVRGRVVRLPGDPRIAHPSDAPDETIELPSQTGATTSTQPRAPYSDSPAERFHRSTPGRLLLQPQRRARGQAAGGRNQGGGVTYPPLPFTSFSPPTRSTTHNSKTSADATTNAPRTTTSRGQTTTTTGQGRTTTSGRGNTTTTTSHTTGGRRRQVQFDSRSSLTQSLQLPQQTQYDNPPITFWDAEHDDTQDFDPEERMEMHTPEPEDIPDPDDLIRVVMDNGEEVILSRSEADNFALSEALAELAHPMSPGPEDIEQFNAAEHETPPSQRRQNTRRPLGEIDVAPPSDKFSGLNMTAYLLRMAEGGPQVPQQKSARELKLDERRQRVEAKRRGGGSVAAPSRQQSTATTSSGPRSQPRAAQRQPTNHFSQPQTTQQSQPTQQPRPTQQPQPTQRLEPTQRSDPTQQHDDSDPAHQFPGSERSRRSLPTPGLPKSSGPMRRTKSMAAAPFKRPTRLNATPPPELTYAERVLAAVAKAVPAYDAVRPRHPPSPPPAQLGARVRSHPNSMGKVTSTAPVRSRSTR